MLHQLLVVHVLCQLAPPLLRHWLLRVRLRPKEQVPLSNTASSAGEGGANVKEKTTPACLLQHNSRWYAHTLVQLPSAGHQRAGQLLCKP